jgi:hypothetical protein
MGNTRVRASGLIKDGKQVTVGSERRNGLLRGPARRHRLAETEGSRLRLGQVPNRQGAAASGGQRQQRYAVRPRPALP